MSEMIYNEGQLAAARAIYAHCMGIGGTPITVAGPGGVGKTSAVMKAIEELASRDMKIAITAPTNKAVKVLLQQAMKSGMSNKALDNCTFCTVHKALGLAVFPSEDQRRVKQAGTGIMEEVDLIIVDEASMMGEYSIDKYLLEAAEKYEVPVVFMGDSMQVLPVKEAVVSPAFTRYPIYKLTQPMRQQENSGILELCNSLRDSIAVDKPWSMRVDGQSQVEYVKGGHFVSYIVDQFKNNPSPDNHRALAWRNKRVQTINEKVRLALYGKGADSFVEGEQVVIGNPVTDEYDNILLSTDQECIVTWASKQVAIDPVMAKEWRVMSLSVKSLENGQTFRVRVIEPEEVSRLQHHKDQFAKAHNWQCFWMLSNYFHDVRYTYCVTVHRSQGSTYDSVYVDVEDIAACKSSMERQRLLYVAMSRPRSLLVVNKAACTI